MVYVSVTGAGAGADVAVARPSSAVAGAGATTFFSNLEPLVVTGASLVLLGQMLLPLQMLGVLVVVGALIFYARSDTRPAGDAEREAS